MPTIALSMIVKDAAKILGACLESVRGVVDEIVIADTGSSDSTKQIAREFGAHVCDIPWENDFAAARNRALEQVHTDWVLFLDADEILDPAAGKTIPRLIADQKFAGYQVTIRNYVESLDDRIWDQPAKPNDSTLPAAKKFPGYVEHENVRLFRRDPKIYFVGRVHESVGSRIEASGLRLGRAPFVIHHFGLAGDAETRARKNRLYHDLGKLKIAEMPQNAQAHFELGLVEIDNMGNAEEALRQFNKACELNPRLGVAWFFSGIALMRLNRYSEALDRFRRAEKNGRATAATAEMIGDAHYSLGEFREAVRCYEKGLRSSSKSPSLESKLGLANIRAGSHDIGLAKIRRAIAQSPSVADLHDRLILALTWLEKLADAALAAEEKLRAVKVPSPHDFLRAASLWSKTGNWPRAAAILQVGQRVYPQDSALIETLEEVKLHAGPEVMERLAALSHP
jgi:glycosyltransferase involved in cell wall biosynthesis